MFSKYLEVNSFTHSSIHSFILQSNTYLLSAYYGQHIPYAGETVVFKTKIPAPDRIYIYWESQTISKISMLNTQHAR